MINFEGFWEYEMFGYVSFVDRYCKIYCFGMPKIKNGDKKRELSLIEKFNHVISEMNQNIIHILELTEDDFKHMKKVRDAVAHCDELILDREGYIDHEISLKSKLILLLNYWFFRDIGLSDKDFMLSLRGALLNKTTRYAKINTEKLHRALDDTLFIDLKDSDFQEAKTNDNVFIYNPDNQSYSYHKEGSVLFNGWYKIDKADKGKSIDEYLSRNIKDNQVQSISYVTHMYIENSGETKELWGTCILNADLNNNKYINRTACVK
jgi:hypothetical protein